MGRKQNTSSAKKRSAAALSPAEAYAEASKRILKLRAAGGTRLDLSGLKQLNEIPPDIQELENLEVLELRGAQVKSLGPIATLNKLRVLEINECPVESLAPLSKCNALTELHITGTPLSDLSPISHHKLTRLFAGRTPLRHIDYAFVATIVFLDIHATLVDSLEPLRLASRLAILDAHASRVSDLGPLTACRSFIHLNVEGTAVNSLDAIATLSKLQHLNVSHTRISDLTPLSNLQSLTDLDISDTAVHDLSPISSLKQLQDLDLSSTGVRSLRPISTFEKLRHLAIDNTSIEDIEPVAHFVDLIPETMLALRSWSRGFRYSSTPAWRNLPFSRLPGLRYRPEISTVETINYLRRRLGLEEIYPVDYERQESVDSLLRSLLEEDDSEVLHQRPATFGFGIRDGKIEAEARILPSSNDELSSEIYQAVVPKIESARMRFAESNAPVRILSSLDSVRQVLGNGISDVRSGALLMSYRSIEADCAAYNTASGRSELPEDALSILMDVASSLEDLMACYPALAEIEAERLAQRVQNADVPKLMNLMADVSREAAKSPYVGKSALAALDAGQDAVDQLTEAISAIGSRQNEIAHAIQARSKLVSQKLLDYRNFVASSLRFAGGEVGRVFEPPLRVWRGSARTPCRKSASRVQRR